MVRTLLTTLRGAAALTLFSIIALGHVVDAQSAPPRPNVAVTAYPSLFHTPIAADFDNDGKADIVAGRPIGSSTDVVFRRGNGDGTFGPEQVIATSVTVAAAGDFNGDGELDVLIRGYAIVPGHGDGTFGAPVPTGATDAGDTVVVADFDGNGTADFAAAGRGGNTVQFFSGNGDFTFTPSPVYTADPYTEQIVVGDFNGDRRLDLAVAAIDFQRVDLFINQGAMTFTQSYVPLDRSPLGVAVFDLDNDSVEDLIVSAADVDYASFTFTSGFIYVFHGNGDGTFTQSGRYDTQHGPRVLSLGDFNHDGLPDVAAANFTDYYDSRCDGYGRPADSISILPGLAGGGFGAPATFTAEPQFVPVDAPPRRTLPLSDSLRAADLNGDGYLDLVAAGAIMLTVPPAANHPPVANAGADRYDDPSQYSLHGAATDPDHDWLTFEWRDDAGDVISNQAQFCGGGGTYHDRHDFTLTVRDGRGGVSTDTITLDFGGVLPSGWTGQDIGEVGAWGSDSYDGESYYVSGAGADVWGTADEFRYVSQPFSGDFDVFTYVASVQNVDVWTKAGLMIRESLDAGARHAFIVATPTTAKGIAFQRRTVTNGTSVSTPGPAWSPGEYLRLVRQGNTITAYARKTGADAWTRIGAQTYANLAANVYVGLAVSSHRDGTIAQAQFREFQISPADTLPAGWTSTDVGNTDAAGSASYQDGVWTISGAGGDVWNGIQEFHWAHTSYSGPFDFITHVASVENVDRWTKAGIMMRVGGSDPRYVFLVATPTTTKGVSFQWGNLDGTSVAARGPATAPPVWLRLTRQTSGQITAYWRANEEDAWTSLGSLGMGNLPPTLEVGLAVSSHLRGHLATATFDNSSLTRNAEGLPAGWTARDIGDVTYGGTAFWATTGRVMMSATGADIWGTADAFQYLSTPHSGDIDISALVTDVQNVDAWTKAGLMLRANGASGADDPGAPQASVFVTPGKGIAFQRRLAQDGPSYHTPGPLITAPVYVRLTSSGGVISAYYKVNATDDWTLIGTDNRVQLGTNYQAGLALTSHADPERAGAGFGEVSVR